MFNFFNFPAISEDGLVHDYLRRKVWPKLLGIDIVSNYCLGFQLFNFIPIFKMYFFQFETEIYPSQEDLEAHKFYNQVVLDVSPPILLYTSEKDAFKF
jgi:hypothetical protein